MSLEAKMGKIHLSYSGLETWLHCGEQFRLQRILRVEQKPAYYLSGGSAVHHATEAADRELEYGASYEEAAEVGVDEFHEYFHAELEKEPDLEKWAAGGRATKANPNKEDAGWWATQGPVMVRDWVKWREENQSTSVLALTDSDLTQHMGIEVPIDFELEGGVRVRGYIDRVFTSGSAPLIVDLKTGSREPASGLQLAIYRLGLRKNYGMDVSLGSFYMARKAALSGLVDVSRYTEAMLSRWFRDLTQAIERDIYIPNITAMCNTCSVKDFCYAQNPAAELPNFQSDLQVEEV